MFNYIQNSLNKKYVKLFIADVKTIVTNASLSFKQTMVLFLSITGSCEHSNFPSQSL